MRIALIVIGIILLAAVVGVALYVTNNKSLSTTALPSSEHTEHTDMPELAPTQGLTCSDSHRTGQLTALRDEADVVTGWQCIFDSHSICTAGTDGVFNSCTFPPQQHPWPENVPANILANPPSPTPPIPVVASPTIELPVQ